MVTALILSGGNGTRLGANIPKQYIKVFDRPVISYCIEQLSRHEKIDGIQIVAAPQWQEAILESLKQYDNAKKFRGFSAPGENRQLSIYHGLEDIKKYASDSDIVMIHDAARPFLSARMITDSLNAIQGHDGVLPVLSMTDTIYKSTDGRQISALIDRSEIYAGQAPETFRLGKYYEANKKLFPDRICEIQGSTEPAVLAGLDVVMIPGDERNIKITTRTDFEHACERFQIYKSLLES